MPRQSKTAEGSALSARIGKNIKIARLARGMKQAGLSELLGIETVTLSRIETGAQLPSIDRLDSIATALGLSLTALLADSDQNNAIAELLVDAIRDLPAREQKYVYGFAQAYAAHYKSGKKKA